MGALRTLCQRTAKIVAQGKNAKRECRRTRESAQRSPAASQVPKRSVIQVLKKEWTAETSANRGDLRPETSQGKVR